MNVNVRLIDEKINIHERADLSQYTTVKTGGYAEYLVFPKSIIEIQIICRIAREEKQPLHIVGALSNTLVSDGLIKGITVSTMLLKGITIKGDLITAYAGERLDNVINRAIEHNLTGLERLGGIPGTVGGAVKGNAGANGMAISDVFFYADCISADGTLFRVPNYNDIFSYRKSSFGEGTIIATASFRLTPNKNTVEARLQKEKYRSERIAKGQYEYPNLGCFFKNPETIPAGKLIDECGLKGKRVNDAMVSNRHAAFIVSTGKATSSDIKTLSEEVRRIVKEKCGIELEYEICFLE